MTSPASAAKELARALRPSEQQLSELKEYADFCGIPAVVVNRLTRMELNMTFMFTRTLQILIGYLDTISNLEALTGEQYTFYREIMVFKNTIDLYNSCKEDPAKMLQWVSGFSALWIVSQAMSENGIKSGVFGGHEGFFHFGRSAWTEGSKKYGNVLASMNILIKKMAKWAGVEQGKNQDADNLIFKIRLENLREDPIKPTGINLLVQAVMDEAARNFLENLPAAGTKKLPVA